MHAMYIGVIMVQTWCAIDSTSYCCALHTLSLLDLLVPSGVPFIADKMPGLVQDWEPPKHVFRLHRHKRCCKFCLKTWSVHLLGAMLSYMTDLNASTARKGAPQVCKYSDTTTLTREDVDLAVSPRLL